MTVHTNCPIVANVGINAKFEKAKSETGSHLTVLGDSVETLERH